MSNEALKNARYSVASLGSTEAAILEDQPAAKDLFIDIQKLKAEKYEAQKKAQRKAAEPFDEKIDELEREYALFLKLSG